MRRLAWWLLRVSGDRASAGRLRMLEAVGPSRLDEMDMTRERMERLRARLDRLDDIGRNRARERSPAWLDYHGREP